MSETTQLWFFGGFIGALVIIGSALLHHMLHCKGNTEAISDIKDDIKDTIRPEIKTLRERSHEQQNAILKLDGSVAVLQERTK